MLIDGHISAWSAENRIPRNFQGMNACTTPLWGRFVPQDTMVPIYRTLIQV